MRGWLSRRLRRRARSRQQCRARRALPLPAPSPRPPAPSPRASPGGPLRPRPDHGSRARGFQPPTVASSSAPAGTAPVTGASAGGVVDAAAGASAARLADPNFASPVAHAAFEAAQKELGVPYLYGGESPQAGFDCSGLMQWAYHQAGVNLPRVADQQFTVGTPVGLNDLKEGDLVFFRIGGGDVDHVGHVRGQPQFLEAPRTGEDVAVGGPPRLLTGPLQFAGGRRVVPLTGAGLSRRR